MSHKLFSLAALGIRRFILFPRTNFGNNYNIGRILRRTSGISRDMSDMLEEYTVPDWAERLQNKPTHRVKLAHPDTPIDEWKIPDIPHGFSVHIKRDDMTGSTLSGNKVRKLEFLLADAVKHNCRHVITCGGVQSNHCRAVAVASRQLGLEPHLFLRGDIQSKSSVECNGNLLLDRMCGADLYIVPRQSAYLTELRPRMLRLAELIKQQTGESSYLIPVGGSNEVGFYGYIQVMEELRKQGVLERFDDLIFSCGSGGTAAGLAIGNYLTGSKLRIHGVAVSDDAAYFHSHVNEMLSALGLADVKSEDIVDIVEGYKGKGYGISSPGELDLITEISCKTGIILDPVYTGKGAYGMWHELKRNPDRFHGKRILFLHTGGVFGLYDGRMDALLKSKADTNKIKFWLDKNSDYS
ncbi:bifunctional D-cysteine desulfhydrase/1-aminocyclopropane-1-carboxylate deaminase, mitochondrial-like [Gigantopelta aegis]|uniref:bifunctional D-cysteine desulfhydrase/1-aminocyclopropane-1-carboxylate deaminase, mitochondrial-like n=1 Tax=Gigantopelta aegis TaxID=1735272 RepID=UPI001B889AAA|nr:bifunctional D-cysteine desulfhydrase/1-aminocyclopropane-1-carboxylate deaminase, mitochondrial-like [Gigantopelta aegis]